MPLFESLDKSNLKRKNKIEGGFDYWYCYVIFTIGNIIKIFTCIDSIVVPTCDVPPINTNT